MALPAENGHFSDVDDCHDEEWEVQGTETSKHPNISPSVSSSSAMFCGSGSGNGQTGK